MANSGDFAASEDHEYFLAIEDVFIRLRGAPLLLSPEDWRVAKRWREEGIPLTLVERTLEEVFEKRRLRQAEDPVQSLRYVKRAVEGAWKEIRQLTAPGETEEAPVFDLPGRLEALAAALPDALEDRSGWAERITGLEGPVEKVEARLSELDRELLSAARETLSAEDRQAIETEVEGSLAALAGRLTPEQTERSRRELTRRLERDRLGLPWLSLFGPAAAGP